MSLVVQTKYGAVEGIEVDGVAQWRGIPFAKPPVGELRFRHAQEPEPWEGVRTCAEFGPGSWEFSTPPFPVESSLPTSEDCLFLNIYAPTQIDEGCKLPVFVWIYGGAYHIGNSASPDFDLSSFARQGVIGVSFNYRLGPLGFYDFTKMSPRFDANCAVSDMVAALKWINGNISAFGGDPGNVTICGESAGGTMTFCALACPQAKGLFQKAIPMSGLPGGVTTHYTHKLNNAIFMQELGLDQDNIETLVDMPYEQMLRGSDKMAKMSNTTNQGVMISGPVIDGDLLPLPVVSALAAGSAQGVNCLIGTCREEGNLFTAVGEAPNTWEKVKTMLELGGYPQRYDDFRAVYGDQDERVACSNIATDRMFWADCIKAALAQGQHGDVYMYRFDFTPAGAAKANMGPTHGMDVAPGLDTYSDTVMSFYAGTPREDEKKIHDALNGAFVNFCKTGNPGMAAGIEWPRFEPDTRIAMSIDTECSLLCDENRARADLWSDIELYQQ